MRTGPTVRENGETEVILKEHRRWTRWMRGCQTVGEGNLTLTNRRLLYLHRIKSSPAVDASIKKLRGAPVEVVLDHALALHKNNFQIPLSSIDKVSMGFYVRSLLPHFYVRVSYHEGNRKVPHVCAFQFRRPILEVFLRPQTIEVWKWVKAIKRAIRQQKVVTDGRT